jgi:hypothetical protein
VPIPFLLYMITCIIQFSSPLRNRGFEVLFFVELTVERYPVDLPCYWFPVCLSSYWSRASLRLENIRVRLRVIDRATRTTVAVECRRIGILFSHSHSFRQEGGGAAVGDRAGLVSVAKDKAKTADKVQRASEGGAAPSAAMRAARAPL